MHLFFMHPTIKDLKEPTDEHALVPIHEPAHNTSEGSEFLDDAIRMKDQPLIYTEECVAAGSPENLL